MWIELAQPDATYRPGEVVAGVVVVDTGGDVKCDALTVTLAWYTHGKGNRAKGPPDTVSLGAHAWKEGVQARHSFQMEMPSGPLTHRGHLINVDWQLTARADIPWAIDPKAEHPLVLIPGVPGGGGAMQAQGYRDAARVTPMKYDPGTDRPGVPSSRTRTGCGVVFMLPFIAAGVSLMVAGFRSSVWEVLFGAAFTITPSVVIVGLLTQAMAKRALGSPRQWLEPSAPRAGDAITAHLAFAPARRLKLNAVRMDLICEEIAVSGSGTNTHTHTHRLHESRQDGQVGDGIITAADEAHFQLRFEIPPDAPPSFCASHNEVRWSLKAHVDIDGWPDWDGEEVFALEPQ